MTNTRGSTWAKWDLHVHTPESISNEYTGPDRGWAEFLAAIENLPPDFKAIGINDYWFLDGYRRVIEERRQGRLKNIETFFPVIEMRVDRFGGTRSALSKLNYHVIFSPELSPELIESQFITALASTFQITTDGLPWSGVLSREALFDLGTRVIASVPADQRPKYKSAAIEGFNNFTVSLETIRSALDKHFFSGKYVTAVGKTEWEDIKWNDQAIAAKKDAINRADAVFTSASRGASLEGSSTSLTYSNVNNRLIDASDAHSAASLGRSSTWIKAEPTIQGLQLALQSYARRVYLGPSPPQVLNTRTRPGSYMDTVSISRTKRDVARWFDGTSLPLNPGLVAIIGNKGSGKSALADIVGLLGNCRNVDDYSFLTKDRFRDKRFGLADSFTADLLWLDGQTAQCNLSESPSSADIERVTYLAQQRIERICNDLASGGSAFSDEIDLVVYSHIPQRERLACDSLREMIAKLTEAGQRRLSRLRADLAEINKRIEATVALIAPEHEALLRSELEAKKEDLRRHEERKPAMPAHDNTVTEVRLSELRSAVEKSTTQHAETDLAIGAVKISVSRANGIRQRVEHLSMSVDAEIVAINEELVQLGISGAGLIRYEVNFASLDEGLSKLKLLEGELEASIGRLEVEIVQGNELIEREVATLDAPRRAIAQAIAEHAAWRSRREVLVGSNELEGSIENLTHRIESLIEARDSLGSLKSARRTKAVQIVQELQETFRQCERLYEPIREFIRNRSSLASKIRIGLTASIDATRFPAEFMDWIDRRAAGPYSGAREGNEILSDLVKATDFSDLERAVNFAESIADQFESNSGHVAHSQLKKNRSPSGLWDYLYGYSYLESRYALTLGGRELRHLSAGEKGLLLLVFYLLLQKSDSPLIVDQPEENLDNQTVYEYLVPCLDDARTRRQIVLVTHNPNLAVACDADQLVFATMDKEQQKIEYTTAALESKEGAERAMQVLEGTTPAFDARRRSYKISHPDQS